MAKNNQTPQPAADGLPSYDMVTQLLYTFQQPRYSRTDPDTHSVEYAAALELVAMRQRELDADPKLGALKATAERIRAEDDTRAKKLSRKAEAIRRRLLAEGLTTRVRRLVDELVAESEKK